MSQWTSLILSSGDDAGSHLHRPLRPRLLGRNLLVHRRYVDACSSFSEPLHDVDDDGQYKGPDRERQPGPVVVREPALTCATANEVYDGLEPGEPVGDHGEHQPDDAEDRQPLPPGRGANQILPSEWSHD